MKSTYNQAPLQLVAGQHKEIALFSTDGNNVDPEVIQSFGEEWQKFNAFSDYTIAKNAHEYFDILNNDIINRQTYVLDIGCGTGRWTKFLADKVDFIEAVDPSNAIFAADKLLGDINNVRLAKASTENIPFADETFDFAMSVGVLHHIPDTQQAMMDCVKKVKKGGYFYCYLYHNLENMSGVMRTMFRLSELLRGVVSRLPATIKRVICDVLAVVLYLPIVLFGRLLLRMGLKKTAAKLPLNYYFDKSFFIIRNDSLDKFGTTLEQRFSKKQVETLMANCGLENIVISQGSPFYHTVGRKKIYA